jgi:hypothetical protein
MIRPYLWFCRVLFVCTRTMGAVGTRPSLRPLPFRGRSMAQLGRAARRGNGKHVKLSPVAMRGGKIG